MYHLHLRSREVHMRLEDGFNYKKCAYVFRVHRVSRASIWLSRGSELSRSLEGGEIWPNLGMSVLILN